ncbi:arylsulfatase [Microbulbifer agarilyticus]|uniref:arylsulfatase n=1 Tax=Microbulbifer agarilyticus TaxID=260552 RepID=UPI001CD74848|nr:arylsulfatase [Microbulbifer agarilyticus]MCA0900595.1 arylsulfatase [Microbulbifer agarilyticus]
MLLLSSLATVSFAATENTESVTGKSQPNIVVIVVDDAGLMDFAPFGGEANMPSIQQLADQGTRFSEYRTSPLCSPSRAMLLTGIDNHRTGIATIPEVLPREHKNAPGYSMHLEPGVKTIADRLRDNGYRTYMTGKWHLGSRVEDLPVSHGFDRSFALDASGADNWEQKSYMPYYDTAPWFEDDKPATLPEDFYSSAFIVDKMIDYIAADEVTTERQEQPFFAYMAFQAIHIPIQAPREFTENYEGLYDQGWHVLREKRWQKAQALGLIPQGAPLGDMPNNLRDWNVLSNDERRYYSKAMAVNAGMLEAMDHHIGRLMEWLDKQGKLENTLFVVTSDNGPEFNDIVNTPGIGLWYAISGYNRDIDSMGEKGSLVSIGPEWAAAAASPNSKFKFYSNDGGIRVPLIISGPGIPQGKTQSSLSLVTDITPTLLDYLDISATPLSQEEVAITGRSLLPVIQDEAKYTYGPDEAVGLEVAGNIALFKGQYKLTRNLPPYGDGNWQLFDIHADPGESNNLASTEPMILNALKEDYKTYATSVGALEMPENYHSVDQIMINTYIKLAQNHWVLLLVGASGVLILLPLLLIRRRNKVN